MKKRILAAVLVLIMVVSLAACSGNNTSNGTTSNSGTTSGNEATSDDGAVASDANYVQLNHPDAISGEVGDKLEPYKFSLYYNYDWWGINPFGNDEVSKLWMDLWQIELDQQKPDADPQAKLNLMMSSGDLPDVILMDRGADNIRAIENGVFIDLAPLQARNPNYDNAIPKGTQELLKVNGKLYAIPHWARGIPTGGNDCWIYNKAAYEAVGSPSLKTFEDLYALAMAIKEQYPTNAQGKSVMPFSVIDEANTAGKIIFAFYRSMGGPNLADSHTISMGGHIKSIWRDDPVWKAAVLEANRWYRDGLILESQFSDSNETMIEKYSDERGGLMYYDMSQDSVNRFRQIMMENNPGNEYVVLTDPVYPPANGLSPDKVYPDQKATIGWNVHGITNKATNPQRIFDFLSYMLTWQGSIEMMYGPQGDWWNELDENNVPLLHTPEAELSSDEKTRIGAWTWSFCNLADPVDLCKFAVNAMQPEDKRDWVITMQSDVLSPIMFVTDEYENFNVLIDPLSDLGINKQLNWDEFLEKAPKMIMASSAEECERLYDEYVAFLQSHGIDEILSIFEEKYQDNVKRQGFSSYTDYK